MNVFFEYIAQEVGCCISEKVGFEADFGRVARKIQVMKDGKPESYYTVGEDRITISDRCRYQGFHVVDGIRNKPKSERVKMGCDILQANMKGYFIMFGFLACEQSKAFGVLECFNRTCYTKQENNSTILNADINWTNLETDPYKIGNKYSLGNWGRIQHKQQSLIALEIEYTASIRSCVYCL